MTTYNRNWGEGGGGGALQELSLPPSAQTWDKLSSSCVAYWQQGGWKHMDAVFTPECTDMRQAEFIMRGILTTGGLKAHGCCLYPWVHRHETSWVHHVWHTDNRGVESTWMLSLPLSAQTWAKLSSSCVVHWRWRSWCLLWMKWIGCTWIRATFHWSFVLWKQLPAAYKVLKINTTDYTQVVSRLHTHTHTLIQTHACTDTH